MLKSVKVFLYAKQYNKYKHLRLKVRLKFSNDDKKYKWKYEKYESCTKIQN